MRSKVKDIPALLKKGKRSEFIEEIKPMLATLVEKPVEDDGWLYEIKWDGYRTLGYTNSNSACPACLLFL